MHRDVAQSRLFDMITLILERPDISDDDFVYLCEHFSRMLDDWAVKKKTQMRLASMRRTPSGMVRLEPGKDDR